MIAAMHTDAGSFNMAWMVYANISEIDLAAMATTRPKRSSGHHCLEGLYLPVGDICTRSYYYSYEEQKEREAAMNQLVTDNMHSILFSIVQTGRSVY